MKEELIEEIVAEAYKALEIPRDNSRQTSRAQTRAAVACALKKYFGQHPIARSLNINRSTISHYKRNHEANLKYWMGYSSKYLVAKDIADSKVYCNVTQVNIDLTIKQIKALEEKLSRLKESVL